jgi:hypothetical protein
MRPLISSSAGTSRAFTDIELETHGDCMIKKVILAVSLCLSLAACSDSNSNSGGTTPPPGAETDEDVTNTSMCSGWTPSDTNLYSNKWASKYRGADGIEMTQVLDFKRDRAVVTLYAKYKDQTKKLRVSADFEERRRNTLFLGSSEEVSDYIMVEGQPHKFSLVFSETTVNYKFTGPCLVFTDRTHSKTFVPFRR